VAAAAAAAAQATQGVAASAAAAGGGGVGGGAITTGPSSGTNGGLSGMVMVLLYRGIGIIIQLPSISIHLAVGWLGPRFASLRCFTKKFYYFKNFLTKSYLIKLGLRLIVIINMFSLARML